MTALGHLWFGQSRSKWKVVPIRQVAKLGTGHTPSRANEAYWQDCTIPWVTVEDIRREGEWSLLPLHETEQHISYLGLENSAAVLHPAGTVMLSRTASIGLSCIVGRQMATTQAFVTWTPDPAVLDGNYLHAALKAMDDQYHYLAYGAAHLTIYFPDVKTLRVPLPPLDEQRLIARFIARECSKIEGLISEQQSLLELLQEKRQAVISHAVTKGLNPDAPTKPSGIDWLGDVPADWRVCQLRRCAAAVTTGSTPSSVQPSTDFEQRELWYTPGDFEGALELGESERSVPAECIRSGDVLVFPPGSVYVVSIGATLGKVGVASRPASANQQVNVIVPKSDVDGRYLALALTGCAEQMRAVANASTIGIMNQEKTKGLVCAIPSLHEQRAVVATVIAKLVEVDALVAEAQRAIDLLQERRAALISAAVTGQIDVRGLVPPEAVA